MASVINPENGDEEAEADEENEEEDEDDDLDIKKILRKPPDWNLAKKHGMS